MKTKVKKLFWWSLLIPPAVVLILSFMWDSTFEEDDETRDFMARHTLKLDASYIGKPLRASYSDLAKQAEPLENRTSRYESIGRVFANRIFLTNYKLLYHNVRKDTERTYGGGMVSYQKIELHDSVYRVWFIEGSYGVLPSEWKPGSTIVKVTPWYRTTLEFVTPSRYHMVWVSVKRLAASLFTKMVCIAAILGVSSVIVIPHFPKGRIRRPTEQNPEDVAVEAARCGDYVALKKLLDSGIDVNTKVPNGRSLIHFAAESGKTDVVELLLKRGANVNDVAPWWRLTPLHDAASEGHLDMVKFLISKGADRNLKHHAGQTPAEMARKWDHPEIAYYLDGLGASTSPVLPG